MFSIIRRSIIFILFLGVVIGGLFFWNSQTVHSPKTPEDAYEQSINEKVTRLLNIIIEPHSFYVNTTVFLRQNEERTFNYKKTPRSVLYEREFINTTVETTSNEAPIIKEEVSSVDLPGMANVMNKTKQYEITNETKQDRVSLQELNKSNKETIEEIYYDEKKSETILAKHGIKNVHVLIMINSDVLAKNGIELNTIKDRLNQILPLDVTRGDILIIEEKLYDFTPPYALLVQEWFLHETTIRTIQTVGFLLIMIFIGWGLIRLTLFTLKLRRDQKLAKLEEQQKQLDLQNSAKVSNTDQVLDLNNNVIKVIEKNRNQTKEIVEYWMEQHYANK